MLESDVIAQLLVQLPNCTSNCPIARPIVQLQVTDAATRCMCVAFSADSVMCAAGYVSFWPAFRSTVSCFRV